MKLDAKELLDQFDNALEKEKEKLPDSMSYFMGLLDGKSIIIKMMFDGCDKEFERNFGTGDAKVDTKK